MPIPAFAAVLLILAASAAAEVKTFPARDTLRAGDDLADLAWPPEAFEVTCAPGRGAFDALVSFPSPKPNGEPAVDTVTMWWYAARDEDGQPIEAPAVLVVHSLHPQMPLARVIAANLARRRLHAFVIHLPGYGSREDKTGQFPAVVTLLRARQAVADVRRARDAIAALPNVAPGPIAVEGTSLGGFIVSVAAGMDGAFEPVFLVLSGGDVARVLNEGRADAAVLRDMMAREGYDGDRLTALVWPIDPLRLAARLNPATTFLYSARFDQVVPPDSADALAQAIGLDADHHRWLDADHYAAVLFLPAMIEDMARRMRDARPHP